MITDNSAKSTDFPSHDGTAQHPKGLKAREARRGKGQHGGEHKSLLVVLVVAHHDRRTTQDEETREKRRNTDAEEEVVPVKDGKTVKKTLAKLYKFSYFQKIVILLNRNIILTRKLRPEKSELIRKISKHRIRNKNSHGSTKVDGEIGSRR